MTRLKFQCVYDRSLPTRPQKAQQGVPIENSGNKDPYPRSHSLLPGQNQVALRCKEQNQPHSTIDVFENAHLDPFQTYPSELSPECISRVLNYCMFNFLRLHDMLYSQSVVAIKEMWPKLLPGVTHKGKSFIHHGMISAMSCPTLFNAWLHSAAEHMQLREQSSNPFMPISAQATYEKLLMQRQAILGLKKVVESGCHERITDEIVMSALSIALHPSERRRSAAIRMRSAPLSNLQLLTTFTDMGISDQQVRGLQYLVKARGGFDELKMPGLREGLSR